MLLTIIHIFLVFLSIIGIACIVRGLQLRLVTVDDSDRYISVLLSGTDADIKLSSAMRLYEQYGDMFKGIIAVDMGLDEHTAECCQMIMRENDAIELYSAQEFIKLLGGDLSERIDRDTGNG